MLNAVADSTVLVSAFLRKEGVSAVLLRHAAGGAFTLSLSREIVTETETVLLEREHIRRRYPYANEDVAAFCQTLQGSFPLLTDLPPLILTSYHSRPTKVSLSSRRRPSWRTYGNAGA